MYLRALKHMAVTARVVTRSERIIVVGSASLLAIYADLGDPGQPLEKTLDADLILDPDDQELANVVYAMMGPDEPFFKRFGYHVDMLRAEFGDSLPPGWRERLAPLADCEGVWCPEPHDLAVAKPFACRPHDLAVLSALLGMGRLSAATVRERLGRVVKESVWVKVRCG